MTEQVEKNTFEDIIRENGILVYKSKGVSMNPWIHEDRDIVVIEKITSELKPYDMVLFIRPGVKGRGKYVLHRILKCYEDGSYFIQGDNTWNGEQVQRENIIGILTMIRQPNREIRVTELWYRVAVRILWFLHPVYLFYKRVRNKLGKLKRKLMK